MKSNILTGFALLSLLCPMVTGCSEETAIGGSEGKGHVALNLDFQGEALSAASDVSRANASFQVTEDQLSIKLIPSDGGTPLEYENLSALQGVDIPTGLYTLEAFYGTSNDEGWDMPYYYGVSDEFRVRQDKTTDVSMTVSLANSIVKVEFTDAFKDYVTDYSASFVSHSSFDWVDGSDQELYVRPGEVKLNVTLTKPNGVSGTLEVASFTAKPRYRHTVTVDFNGGEVGKAEGLTVTFDETLDEKDTTIDISDDILSASAPTLKLDGLDTYNIVETVPTSEKAPKVNIVARGKIASVMLATQSDALTAKGWPEKVDLANPSDAEKAKLQSLGLKTLGVWNSPDVLGVVDFSDVLVNIPYVDGGDNASLFTIECTDQAHKVAEPVSFTVNVEKLNLGFQTALIKEGTTDIEATVNYNGNSLDDLTFKGLTSRGVFENLTVKSFTHPSASVYEVILSGAEVPATGSVTIQVTNGKMTDETQVKLPEFTLTVSDNTAFATHAFVNLDIDSNSALKDKASSAEFYVAGPDGNYSKVTAVAAKRARSTVSGGTFKLTGLKPETSYTVYAEIDGEQCYKGHFTTEAMTQLPDAGFDTWNSTKKGDYQYLWTVGDGSTWATVNELTTSQSGSGSGSGASTGGCAYKATSGTIPANGRSTCSNSYGGFWGTTKKADGHTTGTASLLTDQAHTGSNAALIRTVGYGSGNSAAAGTGDPASGFNACKNVAAGELYLGNYNNGANYGYPFSGRPSSVSFYYKYTSYGSSGDYGECEITLKDATYNTITTKTVNFTDQSAYTLMTVPLTYAYGSPKAANLIIRFKSSANTGLAANSTWLYGPGNKNVSGGEYVGSELYIDDIVLNY